MEKNTLCRVYHGLNTFCGIHNERNTSLESVKEEETFSSLAVMEKKDFRSVVYHFMKRAF